MGIKKIKKIKYQKASLKLTTNNVTSNKAEQKTANNSANCFLFLISLVKKDKSKSRDEIPQRI
jgi:hypothetical protein